jgi:parallel beta-helix repeat protein
MYHKLASAVPGLGLISLTILALHGCGGGGGHVKQVQQPKPGCPTVATNIDKSTTLPAGCVFNTGLNIVASNVVLDCQNSLIDAGGKNGIVVGGSKGVSNVTIRNCRIKKGGNGILITLAGPDAAKAAKHDRETLYRLTPHDIRIESCDISDSLNSGIYIDDYVTNVSISKTSVSDSGAVGIYMTHSSKNNSVTDSVIADNGYGKLPDLRIGQARREGIAIDSSAHNRIERNKISNNGGGGIFLYKNCQENAKDADSVPRWQHSNHNVIRGNVIEKSPVGVWIASRQSRDLSEWGCGDPPYYGKSHFLDYAQNNTVEGNQFRKLDTGVIIEDDHNRVVGNTFSDTDNSIEIGAKLRKKVLGRDVVGTVLEKNRKQ